MCRKWEFKTSFSCSSAEMDNVTLPSASSSTPDLPCTLGRPSTITKIAFTTVYAFVMIIAFFGNCAIILIAKTKKRTRKVAFNFFIISMAIADILDALISVPMAVVYIFIEARWFGGLMGHITCKVFYFLNTLSLSASVCTLTAISVDRYLAIAHVLREPLSKKKVKLVLLFLWLFASALVSTYLIKFKARVIQGRYYCYGIWSNDLETNLWYFKFEVTARFVFVYVVPLVLMAILYSLTICVLRRRQAFGENMSQIRIQAQNVTVIKMLVTVVLLFAFCWIPVHVYFLMVAFAYKKLHCLPIALVMALLVPSHANGAINPCIYFIFNESYRKGLKRLLVNCRRKPAIGVGTKRSKQWPGSSTLERDPSRGGIKGFFRDLSKKTSESDEVTYETRF